MVEELQKRLAETMSRSANTLSLHERQIRYSVRKLTTPESRQLLAVTGLLGEFAETDQATVTYSEELGDFLWYVHLMCLEINTPFSSVIGSALRQTGASSQIEAYQALCGVSEIFKKVAITKQKNLSGMEVFVANKMITALSYLFQFLGRRWQCRFRKI